MKNIRYGVLWMGIILIAMSACSDWIEPETKKFPFKNTDEYYENLRAYKKSDHAVAFGWYGGWTGKGASLVNSLAGLPDSMDIVSIWGNWKNLTEEQQKDMKFVQTVKGTRILFSFIVQNLGDQLTPPGQTAEEFWGWREGKEQAIKKYANAICDTVDKYGYDGFDVDYEPKGGHAGNLAGNEENITIFIKEMAKRLGPKSGTGRLLVIDGLGDLGPAALGDHFDYFIAQTYTATSDKALDGWYNIFHGTYENYPGFFSSKKLIVTETFEAFPNGGKEQYKDKNNVVMKSLKGMARWNPATGRKGGVGIYHLEYDYPHTPEYYYLREAIQIMNPAIY